MLTANEDYFGGAPAVKDVVFRVVPGDVSRVNELRAGSVDVVVGITPDCGERAKSDVASGRRGGPAQDAHGHLDQGRAPALKDASVRQALNHAVDVPTMIKTLMRGSTSPLSRSSTRRTTTRRSKPFAYDPARAKKLLAEAGYANGFPLTIQWSTRFSGGKEVSEVVAAYLQQVGIKPTVEAVELGQFRQMLAKASLKGIYFQGWAALINPSVELVILTCGHVDNSSGLLQPGLRQAREAGRGDARRREAQGARDGGPEDHLE